MRIWPLLLSSCLSLSVAACDKDKEPEDVKAGKDDDKSDKDDKDDKDDKPEAKDDKSNDADAKDDKSDDKSDDEDTAEAKDDGDEGEVEVKVATTTAPPTTTKGRISGENINGCCGALAASARSSKSPKISSAASTCHALNEMVKKGNTTRAAALAQVRAFAGADAPASCR